MRACEAKSYISSLDYLVAGRMHACIAAFSSGTPVMPVAYSRKFSGLFGTLGYDFLLPVRGMDTQAALDFLMEGLGKREMMRLAIMARLQRIDRRSVVSGKRVSRGVDLGGRGILKKKQ